MSFVFQDKNLIGDDNHRYSSKSPFDKWGTPKNQRAFPRERIIVWLTYWLDFKWYGVNADGWRRSSMIMHLATALLLCVVSPVAALLFFVHPLTLMGSSYVAGRSGLLSGMAQLSCAILAMKAHWIIAVALALIALRWLKEDSAVFLPMIGVLMVMR